MKRLIMMLLSIFLVASAAQAVTIKEVDLYGGSGNTFENWSYNGQAWVTVPGSYWALGVSNAPGGPLLNASDKTISELPLDNYYLYAEPTSLGSSARLEVYFSDDTNLSAIFGIVGTNGSGTAWNRTAGDSGISLGWALGTANLVGPSPSIGPSGGNDYYLTAGINPIPEPEVYAMMGLGLGLMGWVGSRKKLRDRAAA